MNGYARVSFLMIMSLCLTSCAGAYSLVNGTETLREQSWTRSDGRLCTTRWTLTVEGSFDSEDGPLDAVRAAFAGVAPDRSAIEQTRKSLEDQDRPPGHGPAPDALSIEMRARSVTVHDAALARLGEEGYHDDLDRYRFDDHSSCRR